MFFFFFDIDGDTPVPFEVDEKELSQEELEFFNDGIRKVWNSREEEWYFSIVDVCQILTESPNPNNYWKVLKNRLKKEGNESVTKCNRLKLKSHKDGKNYYTDGCRRWWYDCQKRTSGSGKTTWTECNFSTQCF